MSQRNCMVLLNTKFDEGKNVCVGLDTDPTEISQEIDAFLRDKYKIPLYGSQGAVMRRFNEEIIRATCDLVAAYKYDYWFYANQMYQGLHALQCSINFSKEFAPDAPIILDFKAGGIGISMKKAAEFAFEKLGVDAVTVNPWGGYEDGLDAFLEYEDKMIFVWCRGSNVGSRDIQGLYALPGRYTPQHLVNPGYVGVPYEKWVKHVAESIIPLYQMLAEQVHYWNVYDNVGLVVGGTCPEEIKIVRESAPDYIPLLIPAIGAQGGDLEASVKAGGPRTLFNSSRGIIYASKDLDFAEAARAEVVRLQNEIDQYRS